MKLYLILTMAGECRDWRMDHLLRYRRTKDRPRQLIAKWLLALIPAIIYVTFVKLTSEHEYTNAYFLVYSLTMDKYMNALHAQYWIDGLAALTALFFAGIASQVITPIVEPDWDMDRKVSRISMKMQTTRFLLYVGMVILVSNVVQLRAFLDVASQFVPAAGSSTEFRT
jgi:phosphoserine phosphatase